MMKRLLLAMTLSALLLFPLTTRAETAPDITASCDITINGKHPNIEKLRDGDYRTDYGPPAHSVLEITCGGQRIGSVLFRYETSTCECLIEARCGGIWQEVASIGDYLSEYVVMPEGTDAVRVMSQGSGRAHWAELNVYGEGE